MKHKKIGRWIVLGVLGIAAWFALTGDDGLIAMYRSRQEIEKTKREIIGLHQQIDSLYREIQSLKSDTVFIERVAREKLGMARKDEKIYKFIDKP